MRAEVIGICMRCKKSKKLVVRDVCQYCYKVLCGYVKSGRCSWADIEASGTCSASKRGRLDRDKEVKRILSSRTVVGQEMPKIEAYDPNEDTLEKYVLREGETDEQAIVRIKTRDSSRILARVLAEKAANAAARERGEL